MGAPAARVDELSRYWAQERHEVTVLTGFPNHPTGCAAEYRRKFCADSWRGKKSNGVNVIRTWLLPFPNRKTYERMLNYSSFCFSAAGTGLFTERPDVVIASSPQLLVGLSGWWLARCKRARFIFEVTGSVAGILGGGGRGQRGFTGVSRTGPDRWISLPKSRSYRSSDSCVQGTSGAAHGGSRRRRFP